MNISIEKKRTKKILLALLIWVASGFSLALMADLLIGHWKLGRQWVSISASLIIFLSTLSAALVFFHGTGGKNVTQALLLWTVLASTLLMLGFLISSKDMCISGLVRVLGYSLVGALIGAWIPKTKRQRKKGTKFLTGK